MNHNSFKNLCLLDVADGLQDGLSHYSGQSRVALIYCEAPDSPMWVYDPQNLLQGHEPKFKELYLDSQDWLKNSPGPGQISLSGHIYSEKNLQLTGLISYGARSKSIFYQMWFTEHHPDMCSIGPTERWLEYAASRLSHDFSNESALYSGISGRFLREYAAHAVRDYIVDEMNRLIGWDTSLRIFPILDAIVGISSTREEGAWPRGELLFVEPESISKIPFLGKFTTEDQPEIVNHKHVRKLLLSVENSDRKLVCDGKKIVGITREDPPFFFISADYKSGNGFLRLNDQLICSFSDGAFHSTSHRAKLVQVEELLLEADMDPEVSSQLFKIVSTLVHQAQEKKQGSTYVIDLNKSPLHLSGQRFDTPLNLCEEEGLKLASALARVDGAIHIAGDLHLHGFACLLDGHAIPGENRSRGARFNSALRFTAENDNLIVIVISSDRPVSIMQGGVELSAQCEWRPVSGTWTKLPTVAEWVSS